MSFLNPSSPRRPRQAPVTVESLEGRALLSHMAVARATPAFALVAPTNLNPGPIVARTGVGFVAKSPRFYPYYTGPRVVELSAAGAKGKVDGAGNLVLTGIVVASDIPGAVASTGTAATYGFAINRGGATTPGPIPGRPNITFDAAVYVTVDPTGAVNASVLDLNTSTSTPLPSSSVLFKQNAVQVTVPLSALPPTGSASYRAAFVTQSGQPNSDPTTIAGIAPEFKNFVVLGSPAIAPFRRVV